MIPSAAFVVVPRTPGPDTPPGTDIALASSSGILSASLLAKARGMFPTAADDDPFSDPESSLYDYQVMEEAGYSSVEFGHAGGSRKRISYSDREPVPLPGPSTLREHTIDEEMPGQFYHTLEKHEDIDDENALYAKPVKKGKVHRTSSGEDPALQQTGQRVREAYRQVIEPDSDEIQEEMTTQKVTTVTIEKTPTLRSRKQSTPRGASPSPRQSGRHSGSNTARSISEIHTARSTDKLQRGLEGQNALLRSINESLEEEVTTFRQVTSAWRKGIVTQLLICC